MNMTFRSVRPGLAPLATAVLVAASSPPSAGHWMANHGIPYGHPPCHGSGIPGGTHGIPSDPGAMPGHGYGMFGQPTGCRATCP